MLPFAPLAAFLAILALPGPVAGRAPAPAPPVPPQPPTIELLTATGTGCPAGTAAFGVADDLSAFNIEYRGFLAATGADAAPNLSRRSCGLAVRITPPAGYHFMYPITADLAGRLNLGSGQSAEVRWSTYRQGSPQTNFGPYRFTGPVDGVWRHHYDDALELETYSRCGEADTYIVTSELRLSRTGEAAERTISFGLPDEPVGIRLGLAWMRCPA